MLLAGRQWIYRKPGKITSRGKTKVRLRYLWRIVGAPPIVPGQRLKKGNVDGQKS
jgi:hypothetical protein